MCVRADKGGAGSPRAQCKVIREAFHGHREGILGMRDGTKREGGKSKRTRQHIHIHLCIYSKPAGRGAQGAWLRLWHSLWLPESWGDRVRGCVSACSWGVCMHVCEPKKGSCFLACMRVCLCACFHLIVNALLRERVMCVQCVRRGWNQADCMKSVRLKHSVCSLCPADPRRMR